jgi:hypothetical protein
MKFNLKLLVAPLVLMMIALACNMGVPAPGTPDPFATLNVLYTAAAQTSEASGATSTATNTPVGAATATSAFPTLSAPTATKTAVPVVLLCNSAAFVSDVSVADGSVMSSGQEFVKTWRVQNTGTCTWSTDYDLVFVGGDRMHAPNSVGLPGSVKPGQSINLSVAMTAPDANGSYQGYWKLRDEDGNLFGIGAGAQTSFWVSIKVNGPSYAAYDFAANFCDADWQNNNTDLPCPGSEGAAKGYVLLLGDPRMETGDKPGKPGLLTVPRDANNGLIWGTYPAIKVKSGDHFRSWINCQYKAYSCNVAFQVQYQVDGGSVKTLQTWYEAYEGQYNAVDIDLSFLAGKDVKFILATGANGSWNDDYALWIAPRISRSGSAPTATPTNTPVPPTSTATSTPTNTPTNTPTSTPTDTPTSTPTDTPTPG